MQALWALTDNTQLSNKCIKKWFYSIFSENIYHSYAFIHKSFKALSPKKIKNMIKSLGAGRQTAPHPPMQNSEVR